MAERSGTTQPATPAARSWLQKLLGEHFKPGTPIVDVGMIPERRKAISLAAINVDLPELAETHEDVLLREHAGRRLTAEVYVPKGEGPFPTALLMHGGAWCVWSPADVRRIATRVAAAGHVVVSLDYALAPEHPYPAAVEDAVYGARWTALHGPDYGGDGGAIAIGGDSCGATLACGAMSFIHGLDGAELDEGDLAGQDVDFSAALLLCGVYDFASKLQEPDTTPGTTEIMFNLAYLGTKFLGKHSDPLVSPMLAPNIAGYPPCYLNVGAEDALLRQSLSMTAALAEAGVDTTLSVVPGVDHEFLLLDPKLPDVAAEWRRMLAWLAGRTGARSLDEALAGL
jgi:acetyl esterase